MSDPTKSEEPQIIDVRDLIGDPEDAAPEDRRPSTDSPGTPGGNAGSGGTNKVQDDIDL